MADQEFLASFGVEIDESGLEKLQKALVQNRALAEELASAFHAAREAVLDFFSLFSSSSLPTGERSPWAKLSEYSGDPFSLKLDLETSDARQKLRDFQELAASMLLPLNADASGVISAGLDALGQLEAMFASASLSVNAQVNLQGGFGGLGKAMGGGMLSGIISRAATGGRFSSPAQVEIAEDGDPEYVIPVKKESIAVPLLRQLFGELSDSARETLRSAMGGKEQGEALSGLPDLLASAQAAAAPVINQTSNSSVQAPVSINVTAAGSNPEAVGRSIYDVAERYLRRTLEGAL